MSTNTIPDRRTTKQRTVILDIVRASRAHPDAEEVYRLARRRVKSLSLGTVYRNLKLLAEEGLIRELQLNGKSLRYDGTLEEHEHFLCSQCHRIIDLPRSVDVRALQSSNESLAGFDVQDYRLDIYGVCSSCSTANTLSSIAGETLSSMPFAAASSQSLYSEGPSI